MSESVWRSHLDEEVRFWRSMIDRSFPNQAWLDDFHGRLKNDKGLPRELQRLVEHSQDEVIRVLDVGAGPASRLGTASTGKPVELTAVDPLADEYRKLFDEFGITPRVAVIKCEAERLDTLFPAEHFNLVYCRNALDHSHDPVTGLRQMLRVCKPGGYCWLHHASDEGEAQRYVGLHQWNLTSRDGDLTVRGKPGTPEVSLRELFAGVATVKAGDIAPGGWFTATIQKHAAA